jgi:hypothetical protein
MDPLPQTLQGRPDLQVMLSLYKAEEDPFPSDVLSFLRASGFPAVRSFEPVKTYLHETLLIEFAAEVDLQIAPSNLAPESRDRYKAIVQILGAQLGNGPVFDLRKPISIALISRALQLAKEGGVTAPALWGSGILDTRGPLKEVPWVIYEFVKSDVGNAGVDDEDVTRCPDQEFGSIMHELRERITNRTLDGVDTGGIPRFNSIYEQVEYMLHLADEACAPVLKASLERFKNDLSDKWQVLPMLPTLIHQDLVESNVLCSRRDGGAGREWQLDGLIDWDSVAVGDPRVLEEGEPWQTLRSFAEVTRGRWLASKATSRKVEDRQMMPRCELVVLVSRYHKHADKLVKSGWLPSMPEPWPGDEKA